MPDRRLATGEQAGDGEGHGQAMIIEAVRLGAVQPGRAGDPQVVAVDLDPGAQGAQTGGRALDPVRFLVAELTGAADDGGPLRGAGELDRKSTRLNSSHRPLSRMPSSA